MARKHTRPPRPWPDAQAPKHRSSKDTRRWCKGVPGRAHRPAWRASKLGVGSTEACEVCRKELRYVWGSWTGRLGPGF